jgi:hypothetical protein
MFLIVVFFNCACVYNKMIPKTYCDGKTFIDIHSKSSVVNLHLALTNIHFDKDTIIRIFCSSIVFLLAIVQFIQWMLNTLVLHGYQLLAYCCLMIDKAHNNLLSVMMIFAMTFAQRRLYYHHGLRILVNSSVA